MPIKMFDSTNVNDIPKDAPAVIGYVGGNPNFTQYSLAKRRFPKAHVLGLAVASRYDAEGVDVEKGDVPNRLVAGWVKRQIARGVKRPVVYTSASNVAEIVRLLAAAGVMRKHIRILSAHYTGHPHICGPKTCGYPQADGTQWTNHSGGRHLDESLLNDDFFDPAPKPKPKPAPKPAPKPKPIPIPVPAPSVVRYLELTDKDGSKTYDVYTTAGRLKRGLQFAHGKFTGVRVVNHKDD